MPSAKYTFSEFKSAPSGCDKSFSGGLIPFPWRHPVLGQGGMHGMPSAKYTFFGFKSTPLECHKSFWSGSTPVPLQHSMLGLGRYNTRDASIS